MNYNSEAQWYVMKGQENLGPFSVDQMIDMKQSKKLFDHDYVWAAHLTGWMRLHFVPELKVEESSPSLMRRRHPRYQVDLDCYVSNPHYAYPGHIRSLSQGGMLIEAHHPHFDIGHNVVLLTKPQNSEQTGFVKRGKIVNKQFIPHKVQFKSSCLYIITFEAEDPTVVRPFAE